MQIDFTLSDLAIVVPAAGFALMGIGALALPTAVSRQFDVPTLTTAGRNEVRAVYGGFGLAVAGVLAAVIVTPELRGGVCAAIAAALAGMAGGRAFSALIDRRIDRLPLFYLCLETAAAALVAYAS